MNIILGLIGLALLGPVIAATGILPQHPALAPLDRFRPKKGAHKDRIKTGIVFGWLALSCLAGPYFGHQGWFISFLMLLAGGLVGGFIYLLVLYFNDFPKYDHHGSAALMTDERLRGWEEQSKAGGLIVGRSPLPNGELLRYSGDAHLLTIAPTRSGKGVSGIIPNLLTYDGSVLVVDPKGENARITARQRRKFGPTHILDPFGVTGLPAASYNPLRRIKAENPDALDDAAALADALVIRGTGDDSHWDDEGV